MSVEYSTAYCLGMIISEEVYDEIMKHIENKYGLEACDDFTDNPYRRKINDWCGGDYFIGVIRDFGDEEIIPFDIEIDIYDLFLFHKECYNKYNLEEVINWTPQTYIINFVY